MYILPCLDLKVCFEMLLYIFINIFYVCSSADVYFLSSYICFVGIKNCSAFGFKQYADIDILLFNLT